MNLDQSELAALDSQHLIHPQSNLREHTTAGPKAIIVRGEGAMIEDINGKKYIGGLSGLWNVNVGHGRRELAQAAFDQMSALAFTSSYSGYSNLPAIALASKLAELTPGDLKFVMFASGGSEANDQAFKLVRHYWKVKGQPQRTKIISRRLGFHGNSIGTTSATGIPAFWEMGAPHALGFSHVMPPTASAANWDSATRGAPWPVPVSWNSTSSRRALRPSRLSSENRSRAPAA